MINNFERLSGSVGSSDRDSSGSPREFKND